MTKMKVLKSLFLSQNDQVNLERAMKKAGLRRSVLIRQAIDDLIALGLPKNLDEVVPKKPGSKMTSVFVGPEAAVFIETIRDEIPCSINGLIRFALAQKFRKILGKEIEE